jgi:hypothetical protein
VLQLSSELPNFHILIPSEVHADSVDMSMIRPYRLYSPMSMKGDGTGITEAYLPTPHVKHVADVVAATVEEYLPESQMVQYPVPVVPDVILYIPAGQFTHAVFSGEVPDFPTGHEKMQGLEPTTNLNVFTGQAEHAAPSLPANPMLQVQWIILVIPERVCAEPNGHAVHKAAPMDVLYFPAAHAVHTPLVPV